jgi:hypothetical protein
MENLTVPPPDELLRCISECELELKSLRRLLRVSKDLHNADRARHNRPVTATRAGVDNTH